MNVVSGGIAVDDLDRLIRYDAQHMGMVFAAALIESDGFLWHVEGAVAETLFHVNENVREAATGSHNIFGRVRAFAGRILAHVNPGGFRGFTIKFHCAPHAGAPPALT